MDNAGDVVTENTNEGTDTVLSSISYALGANVECLTLTGTAAINGTGNSLANVLRGNTAANVLAGGGGNDTYYVAAGDTVVEGANAGTDTVVSPVSFVLAANVENLTLSGSAGIDATGNTVNNTLLGNTGANRLDGGGGADTMKGGAGDDTYVVDNTGDAATENANEGTDTVLGSVSYALGANLENLTLTGSGAINGTGNGLDNVLSGTSAGNTLVAGAGDDLVSGAAGDDTLKGDAGTDILEGGDGGDNLSDSAGNGLYSGGAGIDTLTGGAGNELFAGGSGNDSIATGAGDDIITFNRGDGQDSLDTAGGGSKTVSLGGAIDYADLGLRQSGSDLILDTGNSEQLALKDWYAPGSVHSVARLQVVADAMAGYDPGSQDTLLNRRVQRFDFAALAQAFDEARAVDTTINRWSLMHALLDMHLAGSDSEAIGGDLAYQYGHAGTLAGIGLAAAQALLEAPQFGSQAQTLQPDSVLKAGQIKLG